MSRITAVTVPKWGIEMQEGQFVEWRATVGDQISRGDEIADMETEKIVNALESPGDGMLRRQLAQEGDTLPVGALIGVLAEPDVPEADIDKYIAEFKPAEVSFEPDVSAGETPVDATVGTSESSAAHISTPVRRLAERLGVDVTNIQGTGRNGRISREDVERAASAGASTEPADARGDYEVVPMSALRKTIARRLVQSKQDIPHYYLTADVCLDPLLERRQQLDADGVQASVNDLLVKAVAHALIDVPDVNAQLVGDEIRRFPNANIAIAVATDAGLMTPVVRSAESKSVGELAAIIRELTQRARAGQLNSKDVVNGSFTVSNLGMHGVRNFTAVVNPPQVAILAVGAGEARVVVKDGRPGVATMCTLTLSCDHRVVDGAVGAQFLKSLRAHIEAPTTF